MRSSSIATIQLRDVTHPPCQPLKENIRRRTLGLVSGFSYQSASFQSWRNQAVTVTTVAISPRKPKKKKRKKHRKWRRAELLLDRRAWMLQRLQFYQTWVVFFSWKEKKRNGAKGSSLGNMFHLYPDQLWQEFSKRRAPSQLTAGWWRMSRVSPPPPAGTLAMKRSDLEKWLAAATQHRLLQPKNTEQASCLQSLFPRWRHEINPKDSGNILSGLPSYLRPVEKEDVELTSSLWAGGASQEVANIHPTFFKFDFWSVILLSAVNDI